MAVIIAARSKTDSGTARASGSADATARRAQQDSGDLRLLFRRLHRTAESPNTLVITAARADRVSFGCSEEGDFTYFGRALFAETLQQTRDIVETFTQAQARVAEREQADHYQALEPQRGAPEQIVEHWRVLTGC